VANEASTPDGMSGARDPGPGLVPIDALPSPTARYVLRDGDAVIRSANDAFRRSFGDVASGTTVAEWCAANGIATPEAAASTLADAVAGGRRVDVDRVWFDGGDRPARLQAVPPDEPSETDGVLMLTGVDAEAGTSVDAERIASVVSHDLRNPLDAALAHLEAARDATGDDAVAGHIESVLDAHDRMQQIVRDVLTLARGEGSIDPRDGVAVGEVAKDAWTTVETDVATLTVDDGLPTVRADPARLRRLLENLFRNSVEHGVTTARSSDDGADADAADGAVPDVDEVHVRVAGREDGPGFVVADDGPGIDPADRDRVFVPGYSSTGRGTGLGLTIVERIADAHGWSVALGRGEADGARVEFRFDGDGQGDRVRRDHVSGGSTG
jgi:signal transduction histidine kinase